MYTQKVHFLPLYTFFFILLLFLLQRLKAVVASVVVAGGNVTIGGCVVFVCATICVVLIITGVVDACKCDVILVVISTPFFVLIGSREVVAIYTVLVDVFVVLTVAATASVTIVVFCSWLCTVFTVVTVADVMSTVETESILDSR